MASRDIPDIKAVTAAPEADIVCGDATSLCARQKRPRLPNVFAADEPADLLVATNPELTC